METVVVEPAHVQVTNTAAPHTGAQPGSVNPLQATRTPQAQNAGFGLNAPAYMVRRTLVASPVRIVRARLTGPNSDVVELQLEQEVNLPLTTTSALLGFLMSGHASFSGPRRNVAWQNVSIQVAGFMGLNVAAIEAQPDKVLMLTEQPIEFRVPHPEIAGAFIPAKLVEIDTFVPRSWIDKDGNKRQQSPKQAGKDGDVLTYNGRPIYSNKILSVEGMDAAPNTQLNTPARKWDEDLIISHNNVVVGSNRRNAQQPPLTPGATGAVAGGPETAGVNDENINEGEKTNPINAELETALGGEGLTK